MSDTNWLRVRELFDSALRQKPEERQNHVRQACDGDQELLAEVESLLSSLERSEDFMEAPAVASVADIIGAQRKKLEAGTRFGHYEVIRLIGVGGMGEVYLARDEKLDRPVALKMLNEEFSQHESNLQRFIQEAKAASALNHPNILVIHEIDEANDVHYIVSEFVDGQTLRGILEEKALPVMEVLDVSIQIASALTSAHEAHLVHCDIKPENLMVRPDGYVKVLDFGLAKLVEKKSTAERDHDIKGAILGTVNYMSPEQARGEGVDERTDIFSLGVVIYEMIARRTPFAGDSVTETLANLIDAELEPLPSLGVSVPGGLRQIITRMLNRKKDERYQSMNQVLKDLKDLRKNLSFDGRIKLYGLSAPYTSVSPVTTPTPTTPDVAIDTSSSSRIRWRLPLALAAVVLLIGFLAWTMWPE